MNISIGACGALRATGVSIVSCPTATTTTTIIQLRMTSIDIVIANIRRIMTLHEHYFIHGHMVTAIAAAAAAAAATTATTTCIRLIGIVVRVVHADRFGLEAIAA
jgi:hypothetical protein